MQLVMDSPEIRRQLMELKTYALAHPLDLRQGIPPDHKPAGDDPRHVLTNGTTRIVYSVEIQPDPRWGQTHHLSVSKVGGKPPNPAVVNFVMELLGMGNLMDGNPMRSLDMEDEYAINIHQPIHTHRYSPTASTP
jgi:hypothetical protein